MEKVIRILIVDDHAIVREGLAALVQTAPGLAVAGEAADGEEAVAQARALQPEVILLDLAMPRKDGLAAIPEIKGVSSESRILVLTALDDDKRASLALRAGAHGYLLKDSTSEEVLQAIRTVYAGESVLDPAVTQKLLNARTPNIERADQEQLTAREAEVLQLIAQGCSNQEIAEKLTISEHTVRKHTVVILDKLHLKNRTQAALYALRSGLATAD